MDKTELCEMRQLSMQKLNELHEARKQVVKAINNFLAENNGEITIICNKEKDSWIRVTAKENANFEVLFDHTQKPFLESELGDTDVFDLNNFIINYYYIEY